MKVREKISDKTVNYPNKDLVPLVGHVGSEEYYEIVENERPTFDYRTHKLNRVETYTENIGVLLPIWEVTWELNQKTDGEIIKSINNAANEWIESFFPQYEENRLFRKKNKGGNPQDYKDFEDWTDIVESEAQAMITALSLVPDFNFTPFTYSRWNMNNFQSSSFTFFMNMIFPIFIPI